MFQGFWRDLVEAGQAMLCALVETGIIVIGAVAILTAAVAVSWRLWAWIA